MNYMVYELNHRPQDVLLSKEGPTRQKHEYDFKAKADRPKRIIIGRTIVILYTHYLKWSGLNSTKESR
jgi:hypothetical protein